MPAAETQASTAGPRTLGEPRPVLGHVSVPPMHSRQPLTETTFAGTSWLTPSSPTQAPTSKCFLRLEWLLLLTSAAAQAASSRPGPAVVQPALDRVRIHRRRTPTISADVRHTAAAARKPLCEASGERRHRGERRAPGRPDTRTHAVRRRPRLRVAQDPGAACPCGCTLPLGTRLRARARLRQ